MLNESTVQAEKPLTDTHVNGRSWQTAVLFLGPLWID